MKTGAQEDMVRIHGVGAYGEERQRIILKCCTDIFRKPSDHYGVFQDLE